MMPPPNFHASEFHHCGFAGLRLYRDAYTYYGSIAMHADALTIAPSQCIHLLRLHCERKGGLAAANEQGRCVWLVSERVLV